MSRLNLDELKKLSDSTTDIDFTRGEGAILLPDVCGSAEGEAIALGVVKVDVDLETSVKEIIQSRFIFKAYFA